MNKKLHILFLSGWYPSRVFPTNGNFVQRHAEAIASQHKVTLIHVITDENIKIIENVSYNKNNVNTHIVYIKKKNNPILKFILFIKAYLKAVNAIDNFDIVHLNITFPVGLIALYLKWFKKKPFIITEHWSGFLPEDKVSLSFFKKIITKIIITQANYIVVVSKHLKDQMLKNGFKGNYRVLGNIIDTSIFYPKEKSFKEFEIIHISNFDENSKNIHGILSTIKNISKIRTDFTFKIIGDGDLDNLHKKIISHQIPSGIIKIEGKKTSSEIAEILQQANVYISFSNYETFGIVMIEALACGTPVISTDTGILIELEPSDFITIIKKNNEDALLKAILERMINAFNLDTKNIHNYIAKLFGSEKIINAYSKIYYNTIKFHKN